MVGVTGSALIRQALPDPSDRREMDLGFTPDQVLVDTPTRMIYLISPDRTSIYRVPLAFDHPSVRGLGPQQFVGGLPRMGPVAVSGLDRVVLYVDPARRTLNGFTVDEPDDREVYRRQFNPEYMTIIDK